METELDTIRAELDRQQVLTKKALDDKREYEE